ncbi:4Fe-4S binding protein [Chloroflexota bacterium]
MPGNMALVDFNKCLPDKCKDGICAAAAACPRKLLKQETPGQPPMPDPFLCKGCSDCVRACPQKAVSLTKT